jgi:hypothetical protein
MLAALASGYNFAEAFDYARSMQVRSIPLLSCHASSPMACSRTLRCLLSIDLHGASQSDGRFSGA